MTEHDRSEEVAWLAGASIGGRYLYAAYDENRVSFSVRDVAADGVTHTSGCDLGTYQWNTLIDQLVDGVTDGAVLPAVVRDYAGEWVRNRAADERRPCPCPSVSCVSVGQHNREGR